MKKPMVYILAFAMVFSALLSGCGEKKDVRPSPTLTPEATILPEEMMPDVEDGIVNDDDGVITQDDNGPLEEDPIRAGVNDMENDVEHAVDSVEDSVENAAGQMTNGMDANTNTNAGTNSARP